MRCILPLDNNDRLVQLRLGPRFSDDLAAAPILQPDGSTADV